MSRTEVQLYFHCRQTKWNYDFILLNGVAHFVRLITTIRHTMDKRLFGKGKDSEILTEIIDKK